VSQISIQHMTKRFGSDAPAVDDVSLEIGDGEFVILVGPSGSGKSTLLQMIVGLEDITEGDLYIDGERVNDAAPRDRNLAMVFQSYALYPHLTVYENIAFPMRLKKVPDDEVDRRVRNMADLLDINEFLDRKPANLSGGQRQRVAMGRAMVREAHAYLFDEPLSNLDAKLRVQMRTEISRLQKRFGTTTVYVTHDQIEAMTLGDRLAVLRKGTLQQVGSPKELYDRPVNLFVAGFIGSPSMNFLPAEVHDGTLRTPFADIPFDAGRLTDRVKDGDVLIAGVRPEEVHDPATLDDAQRRRCVTFRAHVDVVEWLGDEQLLYVPYEPEARVHDQLVELGRELDSESPATQLVAKLDAASTVTEAEDTELAFDPHELHIFDPATGLSVRREHVPQHA
jgi:multiple sugar transport system ATP-binding protein